MHGLRFWLSLAAALILASCASQTAEELKTIPIMAGAEAIERSSTSITYEIASPLSEIEAFYLARLQPVGWTYEGLGEYVGGLFLVLRREDQHLEVSAYRPPDADRAQVVISLR